MSFIRAKKLGAVVVRFSSSVIIQVIINLMKCVKTRAC